MLTAKLRELETRKRALVQQSAVVPRLVNGAAEEWRTLVSNLERLADYTEPDELESARTMLADYISEVAVVEQPNGVIGFVKLNNGAGYNSGAQERTFKPPLSY